MGKSVPKFFGDVTGMNAGARDVARASTSAAMAQQDEARAGYEEYRQGMQPVTTAALLQFDKSIAAQEKNLARQEQLAAQIDPAIIEASQQALKLLKGEQSSSLAPLERQRAQQRQSLLNSLRERLGPGAEVSTAGMQALNRFDSETSNIMAGAQQSALGNMGSLLGQFRAAGPDILREASGLGSLAEGRYGVQQSTSQGLLAARNPMLSSAGAQFTGDLIKAQNLYGIGKGLHESGQKIGEAWATFGMSSLGGGGSGGGGQA